MYKSMRIFIKIFIDSGDDDDLYQVAIILGSVGGRVLGVAKPVVLDEPLEGSDLLQRPATDLHLGGGSARVSAEAAWVARLARAGGWLAVGNRLDVEGEVEEEQDGQHQAEVGVEVGVGRVDVDGEVDHIQENEDPADQERHHGEALEESSGVPLLATPRDAVLDEEQQEGAEGQDGEDVLQGWHHSVV